MGISSTWAVATEADRAKYERALLAIVARINGVYDDPYLVEFGPLLADTEADVLRIAIAALGEAR
jgi:hypothetical protein